MYEHKPFVNGQITGCTSEESAYLVKDYPYGFRARTTIRYWIETTKQGQRQVSQTMNPKNGRWNSPKKSTYSTIRVMGLDEIGHVVFDGIHMGCGEDEAIRFEKSFELDEYQKKAMLLIMGMALGQKFIKYTVTSGSLEEMKDTPRQTEEEQREILKRASLAGLSEVLTERDLTVKDVMEVSLVPTGRCKICDNMTKKPQECFLPDKLGTQYNDAPYCKARKLHYDYIRQIDEGKQDCRYFKQDGIT